MNLLWIFWREAVVISVKNLSGIVSIDEDNNWVCAAMTERLPNPVDETRELVSILEQYLDLRGVVLPEGYLSYKVVCPNPEFGFDDSDLSPPEVISQLTQLKPEQRTLRTKLKHKQRTLYSKLVKGGWKEKTQESFIEKLNFVLSTAPISDRLELEGNKCILGKFLDFKGTQDNTQLLRKMKRSKVNCLTFQNACSFGSGNGNVGVLSTLRDYRGEEPSSSSQQVFVNSNTEAVFQAQNSTKSRNFKLSSVRSISLSA